MKKSISLVLAGMVLTQSTYTFAQTNGNVSPVLPVITPGSGAGSTVIFGPSGQQSLNQITQDNTRLASEALAQAATSAKIDLEYVQSVTADLNSQLNALANLKMKFIQLSQKSSVQGFISLEEYLNLVNEINNRDQTLQIDMKTKTLITRDTLPSYNSIEAGGMKVTVSNPGNVRMDKVIASVEVARASMINEMNNIPFPNMQSRLGQPASVQSNALHPVLTGIRILSEAEIVEKRNLVQEKLTPTSNTMKNVNRYADLIVTELTTFLRLHASDEYLRFRNDNDKQASQETYARLVDGFFRRSYIRRKFKMRLGAMRTATFDKKLVNIEDFTYQPMLMVLKSLRREAAMTEPDVLQAYEDVRNWVELYDKKLTPVFVSKAEIMKNPEKAKEYASKNTGILVRANSAINSITFQDNAAEMLLMVMRLILADATEELLLLGNDTSGLASLHTGKYRSTAEQKAAYNLKACQMDFLMSAADAQAVCKNGVKAPMPANQGGGKSFAEVFANLLLDFGTVEAGRRQEADFAMQMIQQAILVGGPAASGPSDMFE